MDFDPVILSIPIFFGLILLELGVEYFSKNTTYDFGDSVSNIGTGALQQVSGTFVQVLTIGLYAAIFQYLAPVKMPNTWLTYVVLFVAYDFCYYWYHRKSHEISLLWGGHVVHHQSEHYNLSVALRQSSTGFLFAFLFYLPLAFLGFDPIAFAFVGGLNLLYQFWIHTEHIGKMGPLEWVFNTPSHHRVHHARDPKYIDKNYAGVFIVWDRLFGTFIEEDERPHYGVTKPLNSWNPVYANVVHYVDLFKAASKAHSFGDAWGILFNKPGWMPAYMGGYQAPASVASNYRPYKTDNMLLVNMYLFVQFVFALGIISLYLFRFESMPMSLKVVLALWILCSTLLFGVLLEHKTWAYWAELLRLAALPLLCLWMFDLGLLSAFPTAILLFIGVFTVISIGLIFYFIVTKIYK
jgi:alkylglycerol monooxygenase